MGLDLKQRLETVRKGNLIRVKDAHHLHLEFVKMVLQKFFLSHSRAIKVQNRTINCLLGSIIKQWLNLNPFKIKDYALFAVPKDIVLKFMTRQTIGGRELP
jgi:hypothetical protein